MDNSFCCAFTCIDDVANKSQEVELFYDANSLINTSTAKIHENANTEPAIQPQHFAKNQPSTEKEGKIIHTANNTEHIIKHTTEKIEHKDRNVHKFASNIKHKTNDVVEHRANKHPQESANKRIDEHFAGKINHKDGKVHSLVSGNEQKKHDYFDHHVDKHLQDSTDERIDEKNDQHSAEKIEHKDGKASESVSDTKHETHDDVKHHINTSYAQKSTSEHSAGKINRKDGKVHTFVSNTKQKKHDSPLNRHADKRPQDSTDERVDENNDDHSAEKIEHKDRKAPESGSDAKHETHDDVKYLANEHPQESTDEHVNETSTEKIELKDGKVHESVSDTKHKTQVVLHHHAGRHIRDVASKHGDEHATERSKTSNFFSSIKRKLTHVFLGDQIRHPKNSTREISTEITVHKDGKIHKFVLDAKNKMHNAVEQHHAKKHSQKSTNKPINEHSTEKIGHKDSDVKQLVTDVNYVITDTFHSNPNILANEFRNEPSAENIDHENNGISRWAFNSKDKIHEALYDPTKEVTNESAQELNDPLVSKTNYFTENMKTKGRQLYGWARNLRNKLHENQRRISSKSLFELWN